MTRIWTVGIDGSDDANTALRWTAHLARDLDEEVQPVVAWHVPIPIVGSAGRRPIDVDRAGLEATAEVVGRSVVDECDVRGARVLEATIVEGHPADVLLARSDADHPIVVGRRGVSRLRHRLLGSTSSDLAMHATGPVIVVPADVGARAPRHIVVGFDGSHHSAAALEWSLGAAADEAVVEALVAVDVIPWLSPAAVAQQHPEAIESARARIGAALDRADPEGRAERNFVLHGPHQALCEAFDRADLIVVGPRGVGVIARTILGSITSWLLTGAPCPIAVVPST